MKTIQRLADVQHSVLQSILNYCQEATEDVDQEIEINHFNEVIGNVKIKVSVNVLVSNYDSGYPPTSDDVEMTLESAHVEMIYSSKDKELPNITKAINDFLYRNEGELLKF